MKWNCCAMQVMMFAQSDQAFLWLMDTVCNQNSNQTVLLIYWVNSLLDSRFYLECQALFSLER